MPETVVADPIEVANRLEVQFRLTRDELLDVVDAMVRARIDCTANDPAGSRGWAAYQIGTRRMREIGGPAGYVRDSSDQIESAYNKSLKVKIVVANTDEGTGIKGRIPQNRSKKGAATERVIDVNQTDLFEQLEADSTIKPFPVRNQSVIETWYLLVYHEGDVVRAELSLPAKAQDGFFVAVPERIFLTRPGDNIPVKRREEDDSESEFEISVTKREA